MLTKTGLMLGLGEELDEVREVMRELRGLGVHILTLGQYLRPSPKHLPVARFVTPGEFDALKAEALALGFPHVESGPMVRSSYHADGQRDIVRAIQSSSGPSKGPAPPATGSGEQSSPSPTRIAVAPSGERDRG